MKIGKVYAANTEDPASRDSIALGFIAGEGLLGEVLKAADVLCDVSMDYAYYGESSPEGIREGEKKGPAWLALFDALKAIEVESEKVAARNEDAGYAMVGGNELDEPVPVDVVSKWLAYIQDGDDLELMRDLP